MLREVCVQKAFQDCLALSKSTIFPLQFRLAHDNTYAVLICAYFLGKGSNHVKNRTHRIGVAPEATISHCVTQESRCDSTYSSSDHLHYVQVRVFLRHAILEYSDVFDYDYVSG